MLTDFYELTMANGFFENGRGEQTAYFDMSAPFGVNGCEVIKIKSSEIQFPDRYLGEAVLKVLLQQMVVAQKDPVYSEDLTMCGLIPFVSIG